MKSLFRLDGRLIALDWQQEGETCRFRYESELYESGSEDSAKIAAVEPGVYSVLWNGASYEVRVEEDRSGLHVTVDGRRYTMEVVDPRRWTMGGYGAGALGRQEIASPMPGKVVRVLVAEGDPVEAGQGVVVVEAMKMQNEMKAARAGRVITLAAVAGATVNAGEVLAVVE
jgi:biotin carboxyl carrier protein